MTKPISPLRQRMIEDMTFRNMSPGTIKVYTYAVANFARYHRRSPDQLGLEDVRDYRLHLLSRGLKAKSINPIVGGLRFFYGTMLGKKELAEQRYPLHGWRRRCRRRCRATRSCSCCGPSPI